MDLRSEDAAAEARLHCLQRWQQWPHRSAAYGMALTACSVPYMQP